MPFRSSVWVPDGAWHLHLFLHGVTGHFDFHAVARGLNGGRLHVAKSDVAQVVIEVVVMEALLLVGLRHRTRWVAVDLSFRQQTKLDVPAFQVLQDAGRHGARGFPFIIAQAHPPRPGLGDAVPVFSTPRRGK